MYIYGEPIVYFISHKLMLCARSLRQHFTMAADTSWTDSAKSLKGVILDMCGVLYDSGEDGGTPIPGSVEAVKR